MRPARQPAARIDPLLPFSSWERGRPARPDFHRPVRCASPTPPRARGGRAGRPRSQGKTARSRGLSQPQRHGRSAKDTWRGLCVTCLGGSVIAAEPTARASGSPSLPLALRHDRSARGFSRSFIEPCLWGSVTAAEPKVVPLALRHDRKARGFSRSFIEPCLWGSVTAAKPKVVPLALRHCLWLSVTTAATRALVPEQGQGAACS